MGGVATAQTQCAAEEQNIPTANYVDCNPEHIRTSASERKLAREAAIHYLEYDYGRGEHFERWENGDIDEQDLLEIVKEAILWGWRSKQPPSAAEEIMAKTTPDDFGMEDCDGDNHHGFTMQMNAVCMRTKTDVPVCGLEYMNEQVADYNAKNKDEQKEMAPITAQAFLTFIGKDIAADLVCEEFEHEMLSQNYDMLDTLNTEQVLMGVKDKIDHLATEAQVQLLIGLGEAESVKTRFLRHYECFMTDFCDELFAHLTDVREAPRRKKQKVDDTEADSS